MVARYIPLLLQHCYTGFNPEIYDETTQTYLGEVPVVIPDNTSCCFWVENNEYRHDLSRGCSKLFCCNNESQRKLIAIAIIIHTRSSRAETAKSVLKIRVGSWSVIQSK